MNAGRTHIRNGRPVLFGWGRQGVGTRCSSPALKGKGMLWDLLTVLFRIEGKDLKSLDWQTGTVKRDAFLEKAVTKPKEVTILSELRRKK